MHLFKGVVLGLIWFLVVAAAASYLVALLWPRLAGRLTTHPQTRSRLLFTLRVLPSALAIAVTLGLFLPAYALFEPTVSDERVHPLLWLIAGAASLLVLGGLLRGLRAWNATREMERAFRELGEPVEVAGLPALCIEHPFPLVTVIGFWRPRLYVAEQVLAGLDAAEWSAVAAHEISHVRSHDNLRRLLIDSCFDLPGLATGRQLSQAWTAAAEESADRRAVGGDPRRALTLASALLKVARLVPAGHAAWLPALALHNGESLATRVTRLLEPAPPPPRRGWMAGLGLSLSLVLCAVAGYWPALSLVHEVAERVLAALG